MFDFIRSHQRLMQFLLLILVVPSFALIGVSGYTNYVSGDHDLVQVGDSAITRQEFDEARRNQLQRLQSSSGRNFDPAVLDTPEARRALLESLIERRLIINEATKDRLSVSDTSLREAIASVPELQENGRFSPERYNQVLASMGITSRDFEQGQRAELALQQVLGPVSVTASIPAAVAQSVEQALTAQRTIRLRTFDAANYTDQIQVTDADIKAWYDANQAALRVPEYVSVDYLLLDEDAAKQGVAEPSEAQMRDYYEQNKSRYVMPARVQLRHILVTIPEGATKAQLDEAKAKAQALADKAAADPSSFAALAKSASNDAGTANEGGELGWITEGTWPENLEKAVFALKKGEVSEPVKGAQGYHIFLAQDVQAKQGESFEQAKSKVTSEIRRQLAADRYADMASRLTDLVYDNPTSLQPAAQALGLEVRTADGVARDKLIDAALLDGGKAAADSPDAAILEDLRVRRALFSSQTYTDKQNSGVIETSPGVLVVLRVNNITSAHVQALDKASQHIRTELLDERSWAAAKEAGEKWIASLKAKSAAEIPEGFGAPITISRVDSKGVNMQVLETAFKADTQKLPDYEGVVGSKGYIVLRVEGAKAGDADPMLQASLTAQITQAQAEAEQQAVLQAMRAAAQVRYLPEADAALQPEEQG